MPALPENLANACRIAWHISSWCNYSCQYCGVLVFHKRAGNGDKQAHAFDYQPPEKWLEALQQLPQEQIYMKITGGEPFLDRANFLKLLAGLTAMERYTLRIDTNGSWDPHYFREIDKRRILLNISYHPGEVDFDTFLRRILAIRAGGFNVTMVNYVLAPENLEAGEKILARLEKEKFFVNLSAMTPAGIYTSRSTRTSREEELVENYNTPVDVHYRLVNPVTRGRLCYHPAFSYYMIYDGSIRVHCGGVTQNIFTDGAPPLPREAVPCPYEHCETCMEMYRTLTDEPLATRPVTLYPLDEYVAEVEEHRARRKWKIAAMRLRHRLEGLWSAPASPELVQLTSMRPAANDEITGGLDVTSLEARSRDRIQLSGWAASPAHGPVKEVHLEVDNQPIGVVRHFRDRPERPDSPDCGWQAMAYLPALRQGTYRLTARAVATDGAAGELPPLELRIIE